MNTFNENDVIELAKGFDVDQSDMLESFLCELLNISPDLLYEKLGVNDEQKILKLLFNLEDEFIATPAWCAHCYCFENMYEYYCELVDFMNANNIPTKGLVDLYESTKAEYERIANDPNASFMNFYDTENLEEFDKEFLNCLAHSAQMVADYIGTTEVQFE